SPHPAGHIDGTSQATVATFCTAQRTHSVFMHTRSEVPCHFSPTGGSWIIEPLVRSLFRYAPQGSLAFSPPSRPPTPASAPAHSPSILYQLNRSTCVQTRADSCLQVKSSRAISTA
ncbi:unnamed protein product, partial [Sphacelaria rigidula]